MKNKPLLCLKYPAAVNWIYLFDAFHAAIVEVIARRQLNVEPYLDALDGNDQKCDVIQRWRPWVSTWNGDLSQAHDNNVTNGNDRFQIANLGTHFWTEYLPLT